MEDGTYKTSIEQVLDKNQVKLRINDQRFSIGKPYPDKESAERLKGRIENAMENYTKSIKNKVR